MFCEKAMELVRELHRAPEGQLPAFNVSSRGRACPGPGVGRGLWPGGGGGLNPGGGANADLTWACQLWLAEGGFFLRVSCWVLFTDWQVFEIGNKQFETGPKTL